MSASSEQILYEILGVERNATKEQIKEGRNEKAKEYHPDNFPDPTQHEYAKERMAEINNAYDVLSKPETRAMYDETGEFDQSFSLGKRGEEVLKSAFRTVMNNPDAPAESIFFVTKKFLENQIKTVKKSIEETKKRIEGFKTIRVMYDLDENKKRSTMSRVVHEGIEITENNLKSFKRSLEENMVALEMLEGYYVDPRSSMIGYFQEGSNTPTSSSTLSGDPQIIVRKVNLRFQK